MKTVILLFALLALSGNLVQESEAFIGLTPACAGCAGLCEYPARGLSCRCEVDQACLKRLYNED